MTRAEKLSALLAEAEVTYSAEFVPWSRSRNAGEKYRTLNWRVTLSRPGMALTTDYQQGAGHIPKAAFHPGLRTGLGNARAETRICETGKWGRYSDNWAGPLVTVPLDPPALTDVLYCLAMDAEVLDFPSFEDWAGEYGYDEDSRKGEAVYRACLDVALKLRALFGPTWGRVWEVARDEGWTEDAEGEAES